MGASTRWRHLGELHQHVVQRNAHMLQLQEAVVHLAEAELGADISDHDACRREEESPGRRSTATPEQSSPLPGNGTCVSMSRMGTIKACRPWQRPCVWSWASTMAWLEVFPTRRAGGQRGVTEELGGGGEEGGGVRLVLTSSWPPLDGADGGTVEDKLLGGGVKGGGGLQPSEVSTCTPSTHTGNTNHEKHTWMIT